jgi:hypothetical protein
MIPSEMKKRIRMQRIGFHEGMFSNAEWVTTKKMAFFVKEILHEHERNR